ncbi:oxidoreductase [Mycobacterium sp. E342]|uniref:SDR family NAD(P)-dependent oxidoreductase n=1 Tax=unclassified Mycobacterium TaxID=2642494 RepID=UPI0007FFA08C|nr:MULTISPECIES: SDR family NAD(P)-dependent oxidoreductase [unclassified Mycobacterium]OBH09125.1 oxidoreductase [Mycobacterium sp. E3247]OBH29147.1 oxidoreductase [Mycobacterium sp. E342]
MTGRLDGKVAVVVGGGQSAGATIGNGRAACITFAREGATVLVADRVLESAESTVKMIHDEGGTAAAIEVDVTATADVEGLAARVRSDYGRVDVLHNNVGIISTGATDEIDLDFWNRMFAINLDGIWQVIKHLGPIMREQGSGSIINISSLASFLAGPENVGYATSKAALNSMSRSFAKEYAKHHVRVNVIAPGAVETPIGVDQLVERTGLSREKVMEMRDSTVPLGKQGSAFDVAKAAVFLASDDAAWITGIILPVDGGATLSIIPT